MQQRINGLGVNEPEIRKQEPNQIVIQLAGVHDPNKAAKLIGQTAVLELYDLEGDLHSPSIDTQGNPVSFKTRYGLLAPVQSLAKTRQADRVLPLRPEEEPDRRAVADQGRALRHRAPEAPEGREDLRGRRRASS